MKWKLRLIANASYMLMLIMLNVANSKAQGSYQGIEDPKSSNPYWKNYTVDVKEKRTQEIKDALQLSLSHISLFEYSFILEELLQTYKSGDFEQKWNYIMDSLEVVARGNLIGAKLIPLQAQFFHATLNANPEYAVTYPDAYQFIQENTPKMEDMGYQQNEYGEVLKKYAFSDIVGEGIMMDFLMLENVRLLKVISDNPSIEKTYILWLENLTDPSNEFRFNEFRPREMFTRKKYYLINILQNSKQRLSQISWEQLKKVRTSRIREPASDSFNNILTGTWQGSYADKEIQIYMNPYSNFAGEDSLRGYNKFTWQSDIKQIAMRGTFEDKGGYFKVKMEEYRVPFQEEPKGKQDVINESWGGPEKFYPHSMSYGIFEFIIDKKTKSMKGTWSSRSGNLVREFEIPKLYQ